MTSNCSLAVCQLIQLTEALMHYTSSILARVEGLPHELYDLLALISFYLF